MPDTSNHAPGEAPAIKILICSSRNEILRLFQRAFLFSNYLIIPAPDRKGVLAVLEEEKPLLMLVDNGYCPFATKESLMGLRESYPSTAFVMITNSEMSHLKMTSDGFAENTIPEEVKLPRDFYLELHLCSDPVCVVPVTHFFSNLIGAYTTEEERASIRLGLMEILLNAIEHGNLEIDYPTKTAALEENTLSDLIERRKNDPRYADRCVTIEMKMEKYGCRFVVADEGEGFEWHKWIDETGRVKVLASHGRGILMSRFYFDDITYNPKGNRVTVFKLFQGRTEGLDALTRG